MCLVVLDYQPEFLTVRAVREEYYARPTQPLHRWDNGIVAGRDQRSGGTWLGVTPDGRWAVLTNIPTEKPGSRSRGELVVDYLTRKWDTPPADSYGGFNLLLGQPGRVDYYGSHAPHCRLTYGRHVLTNVPLGADCARAAQALQSADLDRLAIRTDEYGIRSSTTLTIARTIIIEERTFPLLDSSRIQIELDHHFRPD